MKKIFFLLIVCFNIVSSLSFAQGIAIGEWRDHLPYNSTISVDGGDGYIYCATPYSIFTFDIRENTIERLTKINGLSDIGISKIAYNDALKTLIIGYTNTNIDLIKDGTTINLSDILNSQAISPGEKELYNIRFMNNKAYICCAFGITVLDIENEEVSETYFIGPNGSHIKVFDITFNDTSVFAATEQGIFFANPSNSNLNYYESWTKDNSLPFPDATYNCIQANDGFIFTNKYSPDFGKDTILYYNGNNWKSNTELFTTLDVYGMKSINGYLFISYRYSLKIIDNEDELIQSIWTYGNDITPDVRDATFYDGKVWLADNRNGLVRQNGSYNYTFIYPDGPKTNDVFALSLENGALWSVAGGRTPSWGNLWKPAIVSSFVDNEWTTYDKKNTPALDTIRDMVAICVNPQNSSNVFAGSWFKGLIEFNNGQDLTVYTPENSSLQYHLVVGPPQVQIGGIAFDKSGNLWVTNSYVNNILSVKMPGKGKENWKSFYLGSGSIGKDIGYLMIDDYDQKWILMRDEHSLLVFNDNGTITDESDDKYKKLSGAAGNGGLPGNKVYSIATDLDGEVWIGTDEGPAVFYSPENVFSNYNFDCQQILIPRNDGTNNADILLHTETVTAIAVDGANNKWIGTDRSGVYLISPDGQKEIHHFTAENSPLFSNSITSIAIDNNSGEVFFGTAKGLISYKSTATAGGPVNSNVYAYPNPVRPDYSGSIAINGLVKDADFKITDANGRLIFSGTAEGGQAIWDGKNFDGRRANTGVYLVLVSNDDGSETVVTKILFIN